MEELLVNLAKKEEKIQKLSIKDENLKLSPLLIKAFGKFFKVTTEMQYLRLTFDSYEDIFEALHSGHQVKIDNLSIRAKNFDRYSINKLCFDIS